MILARALLGAVLVTSAFPAIASDYVTIRREIVVDRPADAVWQRVGDYCAIGEWMKIKCELVSGSGDVGTIRRLADKIIEPMVAKTPHSYTYSQLAGDMVGVDYHGTLAVEPEAGGRSKIIYTVVYDAALLPSDEARATAPDRIGQRFQTAIETMKGLAEAKE